MRESTAQGHVIGWMMGKRYGLIDLLSLMATAWVFPYLLHAQEAATQPKLNSILDSLERTGEQNPALSRHYGWWVRSGCSRQFGNNPREAK
jgi:hypothetical protein